MKHTYTTLLSSVEHLAILTNDANVRALILDDEVGSLRDTSSLGGPQRCTIAIDNKVAVRLEDEREVGAIGVASGSSDGVSAGLVGNEVAVLLENDTDAVREAKGGT